MNVVMYDKSSGEGNRDHIVSECLCICCASVPRSFTVSRDVSFRNDGTPQLSVEFTVSVAMCES